MMVSYTHTHRRTPGERRALVREGGADNCAWLFMDNTRNRSRQWCSMQACGNRDKARRHYRRVRARRDARDTRTASTVEEAREATAAAVVDAPRSSKQARRKRVAPSAGANATAD